MAQFINITPRFNNQDKRYAEAVVMTCPAQLQEPSPRTGQGATYVTSGDSLTAAVIEPDTVIKKAYIVVDEAFPSGTKLSVDIAGTAYFTDVAGDALGATVSTVEDVYLKNGQTISVLIVNGPAGSEITEGVARVILDVVTPTLKNGNYSAN